MTPRMNVDGSGKMDWFFDEWVRGIGVPAYSVTFRSLPRGKSFLVRGVLNQQAVPEWFTAPVPIYASSSGGKQIFLGTVPTNGGDTPFTFRCSFSPHRLAIDPRHTILRSAS